MELKVWVEGIQRIVCGVNDKTTCQDVVFALAHATGKTGRFTLIERWRNSERLLAPNEQPLKVLLKWGEHSNDVQFILQWAPLETGPKATATASAKLTSENSGNLPKIPNHGNPGSSGPSVANPDSSITPSRQISHSSSSPLAFTESDDSAHHHHPPNIDNMSVDRIISKRKETSSGNSEFMRSVYPHHRDLLLSEKECRTSSTTTSTKSTEQQISESPSKRTNEPSANIVGLPPPYRNPPTPNKGSQSQSLTSLKPSLPPYREPPPPNQRPLIHKIPSSNSPILKSSSGTPTSANSIISSPNPNSELSNLSSNLGFGSPSPSPSTSTSTNSPNTHESNSNNSIINGALGLSSGVSKDLRALLQQHLHNQSISPTTISNSPKMSQSPVLLNELSSSNVSPSPELPTNLCGTPETQSHKGSSLSSATTTGTSSPQQSSTPQNSSQYHELIKIINSQRQKLSTQQAELTKHDAEILFWEGKAKEQQRHMELINKEISRLELLCVQHESQVLSLSHLEEENSLLTNESESLNTEITKLRAELDSCESELQHCQERISFLTEELELIKAQVKLQEEERLQRELNAASEIEVLKKELEATKREAETVSDISGSLEQEVSSLEQTLADKKKKMEVLVSAMKEANLQSLTIQPSADELLEGGHYYNRSGIQRRIIGSPRQLEYSAPTTKNPHGVWV